jgi:hypothetical protein
MGRVDAGPQPIADPVNGTGVKETLSPAEAAGVLSRVSAAVAALRPLLRGIPTASRDYLLAVIGAAAASTDSDWGVIDATDVVCRDLLRRRRDRLSATVLRLVPGGAAKAGPVTSAGKGPQ